MSLLQGALLWALQQTIAAARAGLYGSMREIKFFDLTVADSAAGVPEVANIVPAEPTVAFSGLTCLNEVRQRLLPTIVLV